MKITIPKGELLSYAFAPYGEDDKDGRFVAKEELVLATAKDHTVCDKRFDKDGNEMPPHCAFDDMKIDRLRGKISAVENIAREMLKGPPPGDETPASIACDGFANRILNALGLGAEMSPEPKEAITNAGYYDRPFDGEPQSVEETIMRAWVDAGRPPYMEVFANWLKMERTK